MKANTSKVLFMVFLATISLCAFTTQQVKSQESTIIYILSDGSLYSSSGTGAAIQKDGNVYTFGDNLSGISLAVQCPNVVIDGAGFALSGSGDSGIDVSYVNNVTVKDVRIMGGYYYGVLLLESSDITVTGCSMSGNGRGMFIYNSTRNTVSGNTIANNEIGIDIRSSSNNVLRDNSLNNNQNLVVYGTELSHYINDVDESNTINDKKVYYLVDEENLIITPEKYPDVGFLALVSCTNILVQNLELTNNGQGLVIAYTTDSTISQNTIKNNHNGILIYGSSNNEVAGNTITENYRAVQLSMLSSDNSITSNTVKDNNDGILFFSSSHNTVIGNTIENNEIGIGFSSSSYNMVRGNYFINNTKQHYDANMDNPATSESVNYWGFAYPLGGNYWSDYTGADLKSGENQDEEGSDGIGDTPYTVYGNNIDEYPLLPYGSPFAVSVTSPQNKTYSTTSVSLTYTVSESASWTGYSLDGKANVTITDSKTLSGLSEGTHKVTVYAHDDEGNESSSTVYFTVSEETETPTEPEETEDNSQLILIVAAVGAVAAVAVALLYFLKIKKK